MYPLALDMATTGTTALARSALPHAPVVQDLPPSTSPTTRGATGSVWRVLRHLLSATSRTGSSRRACT